MSSPNPLATNPGAPPLASEMWDVPPAPSPLTGWRGVALIAITYVYFLIFAQFAFLQRLSQLALADAHLKPIMAAMALGGILFSLLTPRLELLNARPASSTRTRSPLASPRPRLQLALILCAAAALLTLLPLTLTAAIAVAFLTGTSLGTLTVTLVTHLHLWTGTTNPLLKVGLGTGLGYLICNLPPLFTAPPTTQALTAALLCLAAVFLASGSSSYNAVISTEAGQLPRPAQRRDLQLDPSPQTPSPSSPRFDSVAKRCAFLCARCVKALARPATTPAFPLTLLAFTALIWLDSAAFFIIQSTPALKAGTWQGTTHLYLNGALHLLAALLSVYLLRRRGLSTTLAFALLALATACLLLLDPHRALLASLFYPIGVSLYSVALVAYPAFLSPALTLAQRARHAGLLYAVGGWFGSAMGIGMGQHLGHIPPLFVLFAAALILLPTLLQTRRRELLATTAVVFFAASAWAIQKSLTPTPAPLTQVQRGRQVYIAEGCINCHSQYIRPNTPDVPLWGPVQTLSALRAQHPPLIGNRRQGPDLSNVALRRSPLWLRAHQIDPRTLSPHSIMPSYAYLFREPDAAPQQGTTRGDDLIAYLETLHPTPEPPTAHPLPTNPHGAAQ